MEMREDSIDLRYYSSFSILNMKVTGFFETSGNACKARRCRVAKNRDSNSSVIREDAGVVS